MKTSAICSNRDWVRSCAPPNWLPSNDLCTRLRARSSLDLGQQVMEALTTNETLFFRDMAPFEALQLLLPEFLDTLPIHQPLNIWSAAASLRAGGVQHRDAA